MVVILNYRCISLALIFDCFITILFIIQVTNVDCFITIIFSLHGHHKWLNIYTHNISKGMFGWSMKHIGWKIADGQQLCALCSATIIT